MIGLDDPVLLLDATDVHVEPGDQAHLTLTVYNPTTIVEEYFIEVLGPAGHWSTVESPRLNVMPGEHAATTVVVHPPRYPAPDAGSTPFALRCVSRLRGSCSAVVEAELTVGGFCEVGLQVAPTTSKGIRRGKHRIVVVNRGNVATQVRLGASESGDELKFKFRPQVLDIAGQTHVQSRLTAKAQATFLKGQPQHHRFDLSFTPILPVPSDEPSAPTPLTFVQKPWLSGPLVALFALLLMAGVLVGLLLSLRGDPASEAGKVDIVVPELTAVEASGVDSVRLAWSRVDGALGYVLERIDGASTGNPVVGATQPLGPEAESFTVSGLQPATEFCVRVAADTQAGRTPPSETKCATTEELAPFLPPTGLFVTPVAGTNSVQLAWTPSAPGANHVVFVDDEAVTEVAGDRVQLAVEPGERCFAVAGIAENGDQTAKDGPRCLTVADPAATTVAPTTTIAPTTTTVAPATTVAPPATTTDTPTTDGDSGDPTLPPVVVEPGFGIVIDTPFEEADLDDAEAQEQVRERQDELADAGLVVAPASSEEFGLSGPPSVVLFADGLDTQQDAVAVCDALADAGLLDSGEQCQVFNNRR